MASFEKVLWIAVTGATFTLSRNNLNLVQYFGAKSGGIPGFQRLLVSNAVKEEQWMNRYEVLGLSGAALFVSLLCTAPAWAYLDPGTGSMIVQALIAAVAAVSVSIGIFWKRLRAFFGKGSKEDSDGK